ncbi:MAG TPA: CHAT domain-containing protein [Blastocatellia bacterium]|nr:CHAT domain-containing protein [Blastocatellia bacterium]
MTLLRFPRSTQRPYLRWVVAGGLVLFVCFSFVKTPASYSASDFVNEVGSYAQAPGGPAQPLEPGKPVEQELTKGQSHLYQFTLEAGQYVKVVLEQRGIDLSAELFGPDGRSVGEFDSEIGIRGQEVVEQVAEASGKYLLSVRPFRFDLVTGRYEIRIAELRAATDNDRGLQEARQLDRRSDELQEAGNYDEALPSVLRALEIRERVLGPDHLAVAGTLYNLSSIYIERGDRSQAESGEQRALAIQEKVYGPEDPEFAKALNLLARERRDRGDYAQAEPLQIRALSIHEKLYGQKHPEIAADLNSFGILYTQRGDYAKAEQYYLRALKMREEVYGPEHANVGRTLNNLASLYKFKGDLAKSEALRLHALSILEKVMGPDSVGVAPTVNGLANLYRDQKDYGRAEPLYRRALTIWEQKVGPDFVHVGEVLENLAQLYFNQGDYAQAEPLYRRALGIWEKTFGPYHPYVGNALSYLAVLFAAKGEMAQSIAFQTRANAISERHVEFNLIAGSDRQKSAYLALFSEQTNFALSFHSRMAPRDSQALELAFTTLLSRKGRGLDASTDTIATLRRHGTPQDQQLFDQLIAARSQLASLTLRELDAASAGAPRARLQMLTDKVEELEAALSARSTEFRAQAQPITLAAVQAALPAGSALIEFAITTPQEYPSKREQPSRYLAYLLPAQGPPSWVDLGEAALIDRAITAWRRSLRDPRRTDVKRLARIVDEKVMQPVRALVEPSAQASTKTGPEPIRRLLIAPEGLINLVPFAALIDQEGRYLVERYSISYLMSGRDLLRLQTHPPSTQGAVVVADPDYGGRAALVASAGRNGGRNGGLTPPAGSGLGPGQIYFPPLVGTADEALALKAILPEATVLTRGQATEAAIKQLSHPGILHVATHGFFLKDQSVKPAGVISDLPPDLPLENPLLRSGLALAGANLRRTRTEQEDDGVLTALEAAGLDLWGTKLVVLSACDTGVGEVKNGDGVYGLRRALVLAGSETQVMSLWPVSDLGTRDLMIEYYKALQRGAGRSEGLRQVQLRMLQRKDRQHPFYWASFIQSGEWANLEGKR